ncbi:MAG: MFS transporter [Clostridia bacterium]|nr:MFS transporter [Clostridia bacterium]
MGDLILRAKDIVSDVRMYWRQPRPGEYVPYREVVFLSVGWMALYMSISWTIGFGVGNQFTGMTLKMNNTQLLVMNYVCTAIGYILTPVNAYIIDNLRSTSGKYRVYIKLAVPSMILTVISLWLPYEQVRDSGKFGIYIMIAMLFLMGQIQGYIQGWVTTGVTNMVHVITPNTQERTKIMAVTSIIYSLGYSINNIYFPLMVDILCKNGDKYNMRYFRGTYTPVALLMPVVLLAYFGTHERLVLPKSRITKISFSNSMRAVAGNKIFWIKCADGWNNFLEDAKGNIWDWMVYRAHIMKSTTYGILNTVSYNANFWGMLFSPWFIKKFGKRNIKIVKNIIQIFLVASYFLFYKSRFAAIGFFIVYTLDRFIDTYNVIDSAIESDMRDNQQYLIGERIDGAFGFIQSYTGGVIGAVTGLFIPWVYKKKGFDGNDYSVLDVYKDYDETKPLSEQVKNPSCVLFNLMDTLLKISIVGAAVDVLPWFAYDITETGQKSMIRVIRIRTIVEDRYSDKRDEAAYIEGCEAILKARKYYGMAKVEVPHHSTVTAARALPDKTPEEKEARLDAIKKAKKAIADAKEINEEIEIADFVMRELNRFNTDFGMKQYELAKMISDGGIDGFCKNYKEIIEFAEALPESDIKEEKMRRKQEIKNAKQTESSYKLLYQHYPDGKVDYDPEKVQRAYDMPDDTRKNAKIRRKAMKQANREHNLFISYATPYLFAKRTIDLFDGYNNINELIADYDKTVIERKERLDAERAEEERLAAVRKLDKAKYENEKQLKKKNKKD